MSDKPMVLTKENVLATIEGRKKMTRRIIKGIHLDYIENTDIRHWAPFQVGDRAYVKEGYQITGHKATYVRGNYLADNTEFRTYLSAEEYELFCNRKFPYRKTPGRFMYKSLARIFLPIVEVGVERVQDISESDAEAEGTNCDRTYHGDGAFKLNPYVFVYRWDEIIIKGE